VLGTPEGQMYPLLAAANLLRIRRQWDDATAKCIEVLRKYPNNASAHSLLGDIYRDQGMLRDAIEWYKLALELDSSSRSDRVKLDRLVDQLYAKSGGKGKEEPAPKATLKRSLQEWLELTQLNRPVGISMVVVVLVLFIGLLGAIAYQRTGPPPGSSKGLHMDIRPARHPAMNAPVLLPEAGSQPARPPQVQPTPPPAPSTSYAEQEHSLLARLRSHSAAAARPYTVDWLALDPRDNSLLVTLTLPWVASLQETRANLATASVALLRAALEAHSQLTAFRVRVFAPLSPQAGAKPELAFIGELTASRLTGLGANPPAPQEAEGAFADSWWHPLLRTSP